MDEIRLRWVAGLLVALMFGGCFVCVAREHNKAAERAAAVARQQPKKAATSDAGHDAGALPH